MAAISRPSARSRRAFTRVALLVALTPAAAAAQVSFSWPSAGADYARYTAPEQCVVALQRVADSASWGTPDTTRFDPSASLPAPVAAAAQQCGSRFTVDAHTTDRDGALVTLLLAMGRADDAATILRQRIAAARAKGPRSGDEAIVLFTSIASYLSARPAQVRPALALLAQLDELGARARQHRVAAHAEVYEYARSVMDTALMRSEGVALTAAADGLTDEEWMTASVQSAIADAILSMTLPLLRDSTEEAFLATLHDRMQKTLGDSYGSRGAGSIGRAAPRLAGDWWYGVPDSAPRPRAGRISLVMTVDWRCGGECYPEYAVLRRLHARYGDALDIVLVARTEGYFRLRPPMKPADEAEALHQYFLQELALPGALTVSSTPFTLRPDPDLRRVDKPTQNDTAYVFSDDARANTVVVVDGRERVVYFTQTLQPRKEREITAVLDFLTARQRAR